MDRNPLQWKRRNFRFFRAGQILLFFGSLCVAFVLYRLIVTD